MEKNENIKSGKINKAHLPVLIKDSQSPKFEFLWWKGSKNAKTSHLRSCGQFGLENQSWQTAFQTKYVKQWKAKKTKATSNR